MELPIIDIAIDCLLNPDFVARYHEDGTPSNMDEYYVKRVLSAEVLTLNLSAGTMRIRFIWGKIQTRDVSIRPFFKNYSIVANNA